jgi:hypothetical protein
MKIATHKNYGSEVSAVFKWLPRHFTLFPAPLGDINILA